MSGGGPLQTDFLRYRYGKSLPVLSPDVLTAEEIRIGSICVLTGGVGAANPIQPASSITDIGGAGPANSAAARVLATSTFFGVASQRSLAGEVQSIRCNTRGVHEFKALAGTYPVGALVGPAEDGAELLNDTVTVTGVIAAEAIGKVVEDAGVNPASVLVEIFSSLMDTGI